MTIEEKYLGFRQKSVNPKTNRYLQLFTYLENWPCKISPASRCLKGEISHKMCRIYFMTHFQYGFRYAALFKNLCMSHEESSKYAWEPRNSEFRPHPPFSSRTIAPWRHNCPYSGLDTDGVYCLIPALRFGTMRPKIASKIISGAQASWAIDSEAVRARGVIVLVKSN